MFQGIKLKFLGVMLLACPLSIWGQILNIENPDLAGDSIENWKYKGAISVDAEAAKQQDIVFDLAASIESALYYKENHMTTFNGTSGLTFNGPEAILNGGFGHLRHRIYYKKRVHPELYGQYQWDAVRGVKNRMLGGANIRFYLVSDTNFRMTLGTGLMFEREKWGYEGVPADRLPLDQSDVINDYIKSNTYLRVKWTVGNATFGLTNFLQFRPDKFYRYPRIATNFSLVFELNDFLAWTINYSSIYDFLPVVPIDKFYFSASNGLGISF